MKTVVCIEPGKLSIEERAEPEQPGDWVKVRVRRVGICGTDFHIFQGAHPYLEYPRVIGHELSGEVASVPENSSLEVGQPVLVNPYIPCGECVACRKGKPNCCVNISVLGVHADGGMCEYIYVPEMALYPADGLTLSQAAMVEFLAIGAHAVRRANIHPGDKVLVVGAGPIGLGTALFASQVENTTIVVLDTNLLRVNKALDLIETAYGFTVNDNTKNQLRAFTSGEMFDVVLDATGNKKAMEASIDFVAHGGCCVFISIVKDEICFSDPDFHAREVTLMGSRNATREDFEKVISSIKAGLIPTDRLNTHSAELSEVPTKMPEWLDCQGSLIKAIVHV